MTAGHLNFERAPSEQPKTLGYWITLSRYHLTYWLMTLLAGPPALGRLCNVNKCMSASAMHAEPMQA